jgi:pimeloyl-ACP methyl ester carboxylesterase
VGASARMCFSPPLVVLLHGEQDEIIPFLQAQEINASARQPLKFVALPHSSHNALDKDYDILARSLVQFLAALP